MHMHTHTLIHTKGQFRATSPPTGRCGSSFLANYSISLKFLFFHSVPHFFFFFFSFSFLEIIYCTFLHRPYLQKYLHCLQTNMCVDKLPSMFMALLIYIY